MLCIARIPICPGSPSCHKPTGCTPPVVGNQEPELFHTHRPVLLPVTNALPHVCHARRGSGDLPRCIERVGLLSAQCPILPRLILSDLLSGTCHLTALGIGFSGGLRRLFIVDLPTISYNPVHRTRNNGASTPAANRLYQGWTIEPEATHMAYHVDPAVFWGLTQVTVM